MVEEGSEYLVYLGRVLLFRSFGMYSAPKQQESVCSRVFLMFVS